MLCTTCSTTIRAAVKAYISGVVNLSHETIPTHNLHSSCFSFFESIAVGCYICRQIWASILKYQDNVALLTHAREGSIPATYDQFCRQVQNIQNSKRGSGFRAMILSSPESLFHFSIYGDSEYHFSMNVETYSFDYLSNGSFLFLPTSRDMDYLRCLARPVFEFKDLSTAAMPEVWRHWLRNCTESHALCRALREEHAFLPDRLIEIIVDEEDNDKFSWRLSCREDLNPVIVPYLTLSHCWGSSGHVKLTRTNYCSFLLAARDFNLPKTYRDAFRVTISLGFCFLWIDSLCIIQGDVDDWRMQSMKMGAIYNNAACNIAATWASDGGDGCFNKRDPFMVTPTTIELNIENGQSREFQISGNYTYDEDITNAPLNRRGWVVQERYLARKQLSFAKNQVYWECPELIASENFPTGLPEDVRNGATYMKLQSPTAKPRLNFEREQELRHSWCSLVETYSDCGLTRPSDKMIALAGLAGQFRDATGDTYLAGLWKADLHRQLCWRSSIAFYPKHSRSTEIGYVPTWSWTSVDGAIRVDQRYFRPEDRYAYFSEILDVSVNSEGSSELHSFISSKLHMRGIMMWARVYTCDDSERWYQVQPTRQSSGLNRTYAAIFWDENLWSSEDDPQLWNRLHEERNSELLLMFVIGTVVGTDSDPDLRDGVDGLVLREKPLPDGDSVFVRFGSFKYGDHGDLNADNDEPLDNEFLDMLVTKLNLQLSEVNLDDPQLADFIHEVTII